MTTQAEMAAAAAGNDGQRWRHEGREVEQIWRDLGARQDRDRSGEHDNGSRFVFADGSAIVALGGGWDIEGSEPWSWAGAR